MLPFNKEQVQRFVAALEAKDSLDLWKRICSRPEIETARETGQYWKLKMFQDEAEYVVQKITENYPIRNEKAYANVKLMP